MSEHEHNDIEMDCEVTVNDGAWNTCDMNEEMVEMGPLGRQATSGERRGD